MDIKELKTEIEITSYALKDQIDRLLEYDEKIPQIDFDIVLGNVRKLYEDLYGLYNLNKKMKKETYDYKPGSKLRQTEDTTDNLPVETKNEKDLRGTNRKEEISGAETVEEVENDKEEGIRKLTEKEKSLLEDGYDTVVDDVSFPEPDRGEAENINRQEDNLSEKLDENRDTEVKPAKKENTSESVSADTGIISETEQKTSDLSDEDKKKLTNDMYPESKTTLAEKFMDNEENTVADKIKRNKINDLKNAIDINQKFLFVNELFGGDMNAYTDAIEHLNSLSKLDEALDYMAELTNRYNWDLDNEAINHLIRFIERRY